MKKYVLVTLADKNFINQAKQLFSSAYHNGGWDGDYLLLSCNIPEKELKWFRKKGIRILKCKSLYDKWSINVNRFNQRFISQIYLYKFYLFTDYFKKWKNVVFLDSDTIVKASLKELKNIKGIAFALDCCPKLKKQFLEKKFINNEKEKKILQSLRDKYHFEEKALNSGIIVFSTDIIKKEMLKNFLNLYNYCKNILIPPEQAIFNIYFYKKWKELPSVYNTYHFLFSDKEDINSIIIHAVGPNRAWDKNSRFKKEWEENLKKADLINIKNPKAPKKILTEDEIKKYSKDIRRRIHRKARGPPIIIRILMEIDRQIGLFGLFLKEKNPRFYYLLKKIKKEYLF